MFPVRTAKEVVLKLTKDKRMSSTMLSVRQGMGFNMHVFTQLDECAKLQKYRILFRASPIQLS